jgi:DNA-binding transcriptional regulator/RsmH inhibitor MraZ
MLESMRDEMPTQLEIDEKGRITVPRATRKALGIMGKNAILQAKLSVVEAKKD